MIRILLEFVRVIVITLFLGGLMGAIIKSIYKGLGISIDDTNGSWLVGISILIILFVLYRNKLQFSGFYKGSETVKLSKTVTIVCISCSILMLMIAPMIH